MKHGEKENLENRLGLARFGDIDVSIIEE